MKAVWTCAPLVSLLLIAATAAPSSTASISAPQIARGQDAYRQACAACHGADLGGSNGAPPLKGASFRFGWDKKPAGELHAFVKENMPPGAQGSLSDRQYADILAAILAANGVKPGGSELPAAPQSLQTLAIRLPSPGSK